jgi:small subunit ribosomal protein S7
MSDIKAFNRCETKDIVVEDPGLKDYIVLDAKIVPRTGARYAGQRFYKSRVFIVERLMNKIMIPGHKARKHFKTSYHTTGKAHTVYDMVEEAFKIIETRLKENPIKVFVKALENAAPREQIISIEYGGARYPKAVECAPKRRIDVTLRYMTQGAYQKSFNSKKGYVECLVDEIVNAYKLSSTSNAIAKKFEVERQADSSR